MSFQGPLFTACRTIYRFFKGKYDLCGEFDAPCVYICRHSDVNGPIKAMAHSPVQLHPWALHVFLDRVECYRHFAKVTFQERYGWRRTPAIIVAAIISSPFARLVRSAGAIPVYRKSARIRNTMLLSSMALERGEGVLIFPDINFVSVDDEIGELYDGFLLLDQIYFRRNGKHVKFRPLHISMSGRRLYAGKAISFSDSGSFADEKRRVLLELSEELNRMNVKYGK